MFGECTEGTTVTSTISQKVSRGEFDSSFLKKTTQIGVVERMLSSRFLTFVARPCIKLNKDTRKKANVGVQAQVDIKEGSSGGWTENGPNRLYV